MCVARTAATSIYRHPLPSLITATEISEHRLQILLHFTVDAVTMTVPQTTKYVQDWVWNLGYGDACSPFMYCYEALTHGGAPSKV